MEELDRHRALADRRGDPLDRVGTHVAGGEHTGRAGLEVVRVTVTVPAPRPFPVQDQVRAGEHEPSRITLDHSVEPLCPRFGTDEREEVAGADRLLSPIPAVAERELLEV